MPQGAVCSSMIPCRIALIFSRSERSSSSTCWPSTERSVVCAICDVATMKFSICTIAAFGSTIRKYATALTRTGTLSFVMTSCGGIVSVIVRRSTLTSRSTTGMRNTTHGPFCGSSRPRRKTTPRSYSRRILMKSMGVLSGIQWCDCEIEPVECIDANVLAVLERAAVAAMRMPELAADEYEVVAAHPARRPDERFGPGLDRTAPRCDPLAGDERPEGRDREADDNHERRVDVVGRG